MCVTRWIGLLLAAICTACVPRFAYVVNSEDDSVSLYAIEGGNGQLRMLGYSLTGADPRAIAVSTDAKRVYVANSGGGGAGSVSGFTRIESTGALTRIDADAINPGVQDTPAGAGACALAILGRFLYVANFGIVSGGLGSVSGYEIDAASGALTPLPGSPWPAGVNPVGISTNGKYVYVLDGGGTALIGRHPAISAYTQASNGVLTRIDANPSTAVIDDFVSPAAPAAIAASEDGAVLYVTNSAPGSIAGYDIDASSGRLTHIDADPAVAGLQDYPASANIRTLSLANGFGYAANGPVGTSQGSLATFKRTGAALSHVDSDPASAAIDDLPTGISPAGHGIAAETFMCGFFGVCSRNDYVYVANSLSHDVSTFVTANSTTGVMAPHSTEPTIVTRRSPVAVATVSGRSAVSLDPKHAFVSHFGLSAEGVTWSYDVNPNTGALTPISTAHIGPEGVFAGRPISVAVTADGRFAYSGRSVSSDVSGFTINSQGVLGVIPGSPFAVSTSASSVSRLFIEPSQRFLYALSDVGLSCFAIDQATGALSVLPGSPVAAGIRGSVPVAMHPSGRFFYNSVSVLTVNRNTGQLSATAQYTAPFERVFGITIEPSGRFLYTMGQVEVPGKAWKQGIHLHRIDPNTGVATIVDVDPTTSLVDPYELSWGIGPFLTAPDPRGRFLYTNDGFQRIAAFRINVVTGELGQVDADPSTAAIDSYLVGTLSGLTVEPNGRFLYATITGGGIAGFQIDSSTGALSPLDADPATPGNQAFNASFSPTAIAFWSEIK